MFLSSLEWFIEPSILIPWSSLIVCTSKSSCESLPCSGCLNWIHVLWKLSSLELWEPCSQPSPDRSCTFAVNAVSLLGYRDFHLHSVVLGTLILEWSRKYDLCDILSLLVFKSSFTLVWSCRYDLYELLMPLILRTAACWNRSNTSITYWSCKNVSQLEICPLYTDALALVTFIKLCIPCKIKTRASVYFGHTSNIFLLYS